VVIVNEAFARSLGGRNPIGMQVSFKAVDAANDNPTVAEIIGVAKQVKFRPDESKDYVQMYSPLAQDPFDDMLMLVRSKAGRADLLTPAVRAAISRIDRDQLVSVASVTTLEDVEWAATGRHRFRAVMVASFAALAVTLAMVGVFGILAYAVQQRVRDFGVRRALGATSGDVLRLVLGNALGVIVTGAVIGLVLAAVLSRLMSTLLFGVEPLDPITFLIVTVVLVLTAAVSTAGPAWRATRIDPAVALRSQ
jgi:putative ABC transport system permease protein